MRAPRGLVLGTVGGVVLYWIAGRVALYLTLFLFDLEVFRS